MIMEASAKAAGVDIAAARTTIELTLSSMWSSTSVAKPHLAQRWPDCKIWSRFQSQFSPSFSALSDSNDVELGHPLIKVEVKEGGSSESSYSWASTNGSSVGSERDMTEESAASYETKRH